MLAHVQTIGDCTPAPRWKLDVDEFRGRVSHKFHSAPGPDGIPYGCCKILEVYKEVFNSAGGARPPECRVSRMVFLPKGSDPRDRSDFVSRAPASARPLSL
eukprot:6716254-Pyramimonas_sp.AAC.1